MLDSLMAILFLIILVTKISMTAGIQLIGTYISHLKHVRKQSVIGTKSSWKLDDQTMPNDIAILAPPL